MSFNDPATNAAYAFAYRNLEAGYDYRQIIRALIERDVDPEVAVSIVQQARGALEAAVETKRREAYAWLYQRTSDLMRAGLLPAQMLRQLIADGVPEHMAADAIRDVRGAVDVWRRRAKRGMIGGLLGLIIGLLTLIVGTSWSSLSVLLIGALLVVGTGFWIFTQVKRFDHARLAVGQPALLAQQPTRIALAAGAGLVLLGIGYGFGSRGTADQAAVVAIAQPGVTQAVALPAEPTSNSTTAAASDCHIPSHSDTSADKDAAANSNAPSHGHT